ncbi:apolipoprotein N-acyltransferase [Stakelama pacifica]|uniref:Apolipoprotein N-acyltransferase n=1 Tax=Stakelama pacifica TaxID=517720 RepID=A0A4R6FAW3_9SPHN|nr:apolipoprotein N-acyltransferase [Stakelama pacifica]TDN78289.1 apolipoprotein N-acyltransferase [Stakelama pacifica]GGO99696.1 apolipoprotein N-acyltransferase [Stakelama pacifica]
MMRALLRHPYWSLLIAGLISATGFAPWSLWPLALLAFALWLALVHDAPTLKAALLRSWVFGVAHFTVGNNWIQHAFDYQEKMPPSLGYLAVVLLALYLAVYPMLAGGLAWRFGRRGTVPGPAFVFMASAAWIVTEWLRAEMFTGYAWNPLGMIWLPVWGVAQAAGLIGTYALSGVAVAAAGALLLLAHRQWRMPLVTTLALLITGFIGSLDRVPAPPQSQPLVRVVQPNIGQEAAHDDDYALRVLRKLRELSGEPGKRPRIIAWPEGMVNYYIEDGYPPEWYWEGNPRAIRTAIAAKLGPRDVALLGGNALFFNADNKLTGAGNSVFVLNADAKITGRYDKAHLVPYGEYLPMRPLLQPLGLARLVMGDIDFIPGPGPRTLAIPGFGKAGVQICYEIIFSGQVVDPQDRPDFLFNPSNDAWFGNWGPPEHLAQARMRAIEEGLPILRATPTGISAIIDADGRIVSAVPRHVEGVAEAPLPLPRAPTVFARMGNWMAFIVAAMFAIAGVAIRRRTH